MFELEKLYINPKIKKTSSYFSRIVKKGFPLENNIPIFLIMILAEHIY
jgi:hypothetical protein